MGSVWCPCLLNVLIGNSTLCFPIPVLQASGDTDPASISTVTGNTVNMVDAQALTTASRLASRFPSLHVITELTMANNYRFSRLETEAKMRHYDAKAKGVTHDDEHYMFSLSYQSGSVRHLRPTFKFHVKLGPFYYIIDR